MTTPNNKLADEILSRSASKDWDSAKLEWELAEVIESSEPQTCLCGHHPIHDVCLLRNVSTGAQAYVGNCCVKRFIGPRSDCIFQAIKRVQSDHGKSLNNEALDYAFEQGWLSGWERAFYHQAMRQHTLSEPQLAKKRGINALFLERVSKKSPDGPAQGV